MGTAKRSNTVNRSLLRYLVLVSAFLLGAGSFADPGPTDLVIQFLTNAHTGKPMQASDWMQKKAREAKQFRAFGGLDAFVKQSTTLAHQYGGLKSVDILDVKQQSDGYEIVAEVKFFDDAKRRQSPAAAEREDMRWIFNVGRENGRWVLSY